jgi:cytochrome c oxidase assembly protein subunit 15
MSSFSQQSVPRWLHAWAVLTALVAAAAVTMGAVVTTFRVGMADPVWPTYPWHLWLISYQEPSPGLIIEHTHRAAAYGAGFCVIVLAVGLWFAGSRRLALVALACIIVQGLLGGARVLLNAPAGPEYAAVHGVFGQVVFSLLVCLAVLTARGRVTEFPNLEYAQRCRRTALVLAGIVFLQLLWGAAVRHLYNPSAVRLHVLTAFAVVAGIVWLIRTAWEDSAGRRVLGRPLVLMAVLLVLQVAMGIEALLGLYGSGLPPDLQPVTIGRAMVRTGHVVVGACILAASVAAALQAYRAAAPATDAVPSSHSVNVKGTV